MSLKFSDGFYDAQTDFLLILNRFICKKYS